MDAVSGSTASVTTEAPLTNLSTHPFTESPASVNASEPTTPVSAPSEHTAPCPSLSPLPPKPTPPPPKPTHTWTIEEARALGQKTFEKRLCVSQIKPALSLQAGKDVVNIAPTGSGKTISFLLRLLMALEDGEDKMIFGVTPLIMIGKQMEEDLGKRGIKCVNLHAENNSPELYKAIIRGEYRVVTASPEIMESDAFRELWKSQKIKDRLLYIVFDEAHCIAAWGKSFRPQYLNVGNIRHLLPPTVHFYVTSATLPSYMLDDIKQILRLRPADGTAYHIRPSARPNIHIVVRGMRYGVGSFRDLALLIPDGTTADKPPPKFLVFFDSTADCEEAVEFLRTRLPPNLGNKVRYFHSTMTVHYRSEKFEGFQTGAIWGMAVTDAFGMVR
ncbi:ATP-dependent DNA helicase RecQ [Mycena indigotica]|uniref:DNA 3'-5' helicase n=1 Tax=Mycena indigotica TaxID=2126181 RepID=A0A8H6SH28_9AGAR|nr:ATP-dependent DNA helicase RecQ [Mycena indigotica]KAF7299443.1 ATP-dependent DNA helicase RecQ [Mycena indigotica]